MKQVIEILVKPDGQIVIETTGFSGSSCRDATRQMEKALGKAVEERLTVEFHQTQTEQRQTTTEN